MSKGTVVMVSSISIGVDTSTNGRRVARAVLDVYSHGLGKGEVMLFPNVIFKVKKGLNLEPGTPNHDLLLQA